MKFPRRNREISAVWCVLLLAAWTAGCGGHHGATADAGRDTGASAGAPGDDASGSGGHPATDAPTTDGASTETSADSHGGAFLSAVQSFCHEGATRACAATSCQGLGSAADCVAKNESTCSTSLAQRAPSVAAGRLRLDPAAAQRCLDSTDSRTCGFIDSPTLECLHVLVGTVAGGQPCLFSAECTSGSCQRVNNACPGKCAALAAKGAPCGAPDGLCDPTSSFCNTEYICSAFLADGEECSPNIGDKQCQTGSYCASVGTGRCELGHLCSCQPLGEVDAPCLSIDACRAGLTCVENVCRPPSKRGEACDLLAGAFCESPLACIPSLSDGGAGTCGDRLAVNARCFGSECGPGLLCVPSNPDAGAAAGGSCRPAPKAGEPCLETVGCADGAQCVLGQCKAYLPCDGTNGSDGCLSSQQSLPNGAPCRSQDDCQSLTCYGGRCVPACTLADL